MAKHASYSGVRGRVVPAEGDLVKVEGGFCVVCVIVRVVRERVTQASDACEPQ